MPYIVFSYHQTVYNFGMPAAIEPHVTKRLMIYIQRTKTIILTSSTIHHDHSSWIKYFLVLSSPSIASDTLRHIIAYKASSWILFCSPQHRWWSTSCATISRCKGRITTNKSYKGNFSESEEVIVKCNFLSWKIFKSNISANKPHIVGNWINYYTT